MREEWRETERRGTGRETTKAGRKDREKTGLRTQRGFPGDSVGDRIRSTLKHLIHPVIHPIFIEHLLSARSFLRYWEFNIEQNREKFCLRSLHSIRGRQRRSQSNPECQAVWSVREHTAGKGLAEGRE